MRLLSSESGNTFFSLQEQVYQPCGERIRMYDGPIMLPGKEDKETNRVLTGSPRTSGKNPFPVSQKRIESHRLQQR